MRYEQGSVIRFDYSHQDVDANTGERHKECLVIASLYRNKVHCVDLKRLSPAQRAVLEAVLEPEDRDKPHRIKMVNDIRRRMDVAALVQNPVAFYSRFLKPFLNQTHTDAYRQFIPHRMSGVTVVKRARISTGKPEVRSPLFPPKPTAPGLPGKGTMRGGTLAPPSPRTPAEIMAQTQAGRHPPPRTPPKPPRLPSRGKVIRGKIQRPR